MNSSFMRMMGSDIRREEKPATYRHMDTNAVVDAHRRPGVNNAFVENPFPQKHRRERRTRDMIDQERDFKCGCGKDYLSYAALFTHCKLKHNQQFPPNTTIKRQRMIEGKKICENAKGGIEPKLKTLLKSMKDDESMIGDSIFLENSMNSSSLECFESDMMSVSSFNSYSSYAKKSSSSDHPKVTMASQEGQERDVVLSFFDKGLTIFMKDFEYFLDNIEATYLADKDLFLTPGKALYKGDKFEYTEDLFDPYKPDIMQHFPKEWFKQQETWTSMFLTLLDLRGKLKNSPEVTINRKYYDILSNDKLSCLQILGLFLLMTYNTSCIQFFKELVVFVCALRSCMDKLGIDLYCKSFNKVYEERVAFCESQNAELIPELADRFVKDFFPKFLLNTNEFSNLSFLQFLGVEPFKLTKVVLLMKYLCLWLYQFDLTPYEVNFSLDRMKIFEDKR